MATLERTQLLKLVVASPGDVPAEREAMKEIVADLNKIIIPQFDLELRLLRWETDTWPAFHPEGPQGQVDEALQIDDCDIMVGIFWKKFGTPVKDARSGTEHELNRAYTAWKKGHHKRPQIMVYFKNEKYTCKNRAEKKQMAQVKDYQKQVSKKGLWWGYKDATEFKWLVRDHLLMYLLKNARELGGKSYRVIRSFEELLTSNKRIVREAKKYLFTTGSRSRDIEYLKAIEARLKSAPKLVHHRVLFGPPYHQAMKDHLRRLLKLRDPADRKLGIQTMHLGLFGDYKEQFEVFIVGNEHEASVVLPSLLGVGQYDSGIVFTGRDEVEDLLRFVQNLYGQSTKVETLAKIQSLRVLYKSAARKTPRKGAGT